MTGRAWLGPSRPASWRRRSPGTGRRRGLILALAALLVMLTTGTAAAAWMTGTGTATPTYTAGDLSTSNAKPTAMRCTGWTDDTHPNLAWTAAANTGVRGYEVFAKVGGAAFSSLGTVAGGSTSSATVTSAEAWRYVYSLQGAAGTNWRSANSDETATAACPRVLRTIAGPAPGSGATLAGRPTGVTVVTAGASPQYTYVYWAEDTSDAIYQYIPATGVTSTVVAAGLVNPSGLAAASDGSYLLIADTGNHRIAKFTFSGSTLTTVAGTSGAAGSTGDGAAATSAKLSSPKGVALDGSGGGYVIADTGNNKIRKVDTAGTPLITTIAGTGTAGSPGGANGDGAAATSAKLNAPGGSPATATPAST